MLASNYWDSIARTPVPTEEQLTNFAVDFCNFHSWYKHLNLLHGNAVVFYVNPSVAAGYTEASPRLHYGWKTTEEYRSNYGLLDYALQDTGSFPPNRPVKIDGHAYALPPELLANAITLYPFCSSDFNATESIHYDLHKESVAQLKAGAAHPNREQVLQW